MLQKKQAGNDESLERGLVSVETSRKVEATMELGAKEVYWRGPPVNRIGQGKASAHHADLTPIKQREEETRRAGRALDTAYVTMSWQSNEEHWVKDSSFPLGDSHKGQKWLGPRALLHSVSG